MPIARFEMPDGRIARFEVPDGTTPEQAQAQIQSMVRGGQFNEPQQADQLVPSETQQQEEPTPAMLDQLRQAILDAPGGSELAEFGAAVNRGAANLVDFFTTKPARAVQQIAGVPQEERIPTVAETFEGAIKGEFVEPGLKRDILRASGELVAPGAVGGQALRTAAKAVPAVQAGAQTLGQRVTGQLGATAPAQDVTGAALSGAGLVAGGEAGEAADVALGGTGETGKAIGQLAGGILVPVSGTIITQTGKKLATQSAKKLLSEAAPTIEGLKTAARGVYKEIDNLGAVVNSSRVDRLGNQLASITRKEGFNRRIHPKVSAALDEFNSVAGRDQTVTQIDTLRKITKAASNSVEPEEKRLGTLMVNKIDDFLDNLKPADFKKGKGKVGAKYRDARQLWRRAKKSELIEEAFEKARNQATGFENGLRTQFRQILNNKRKSAGFTAPELAAMRKIVRGGSAENMAKMIGRFGFSEGQASNMLMGSLGVAGGAAAGGPAGAVAVPLIGQVSRNLAQKLTRNNANAANLIVKAGSNGSRIAKAYIKGIPARDRSAAELTELLLRPDVALNKINIKSGGFPPKVKKLITDAVFFANAIRKQQEESQEGDQ